MSTPRCSVVIATYRRPELLLQTLEHLVPQVGDGGEVIVVEQCPAADLERFAWAHHRDPAWVRAAGRVSRGLGRLTRHVTG